MLKRFFVIAILCALSVLQPGLALAASGAPKVVDFPKLRPAIKPPAKDALGALIQKTTSLPEAAAALIDVNTGEIIEVYRPDAPMTPASVTKVITTLYGFAELGKDFRFRTKIKATGPLINGIVQGDVILVGGGDPVLDTDELADLADDLQTAGLKGVTGRFLYDASALPELFEIHASQPEHVVYNPAISGLNANFNRVFFEWNLSAVDDALELQGRAANNRPRSNVVSIEQVSRGAPVFEFVENAARDHWTVAIGALRKPGGRWLPVRDPGLYTADLLRTVARDRDIILPPPQAGQAPKEAPALALFERRPLQKLVRGMLHFSTNLTAEVIGLTASGNRSGLRGSAAAMTAWVRATYGAGAMQFADHSGLSPDNRMSAADMAFVVAMAARRGDLDGILRRYFVSSKTGRKEAAPGVEIRAKTGSLNFVRGLSGLIKGTNGRQLAFAIFSRDAAKRAKANHALERPPGARTFANRASVLEQTILRRWLATYAQ